MITQDQLKELLIYDPTTGIFTRRVTCGRQVKGSIAGCVGNHSYVHICIEHKLYLAHRLAFLYETGKFPIKYTDHINGDPVDNRWCNLQEIDRTGHNINFTRTAE